MVVVVALEGGVVLVTVEEANGDRNMIGIYDDVRLRRSLERG